MLWLSRVRLFETPLYTQYMRLCQKIVSWMNEWWLTCPVCVHAKSLQLCPTLCDPMRCSPTGPSVHGDCPGKNVGVGCHALLQRIFPSQGSNQGFLHGPAELPRKPQMFLTGINKIGTKKSRIPKAQFGDLHLNALPGIPWGLAFWTVDAAGRLGLIALVACSINKITWLTFLW